MTIFAQTPGFNGQLGASNILGRNHSASTEDEGSWYVVMSKPRQEDIALENLVRQGYKAYLPRIKVVRKSRIRSQGARLDARLEPMFPRYLFVKPSSTEQAVGPIRSTIGVASLVRFGFTLATLSSQTLGHLVEMERKQHSLAEMDLIPFRPGCRVLVDDGPLFGLEGLVLGSRDERVVVLMKMLGRDTAVAVTAAHLSLIN